MPHNSTLNSTMHTRAPIYRWIVLAFCLAGISEASALTFRNVELVCPIDGENFKTTLAGSGTSFGQYLDLKPFGPSIAPWPLAKCPSSGFVMYKQKFSDNEIARLRKYVASDEYKALKNAHSNYYLTVRLRTRLGEKSPQLAYTLLQATWEAKSRSQYEQYASEALEAYKAALEDGSVDPKQWLNNQFVAGELERRLARFDDAKTRFLAVADREEVKAGIHREILELQLQLIEAMDNRPRMIPQKRDAKK